MVTACVQKQMDTSDTAISGPGSNFAFSQGLALQGTTLDAYCDLFVRVIVSDHFDLKSHDPIRCRGLNGPLIIQAPVTQLTLELMQMLHNLVQDVMFCNCCILIYCMLNSIQLKLLCTGASMSAEHQSMIGILK